MDNSYEQQAIDLVKQNEALKAQVNELRKCLTSEVVDGLLFDMATQSGRLKFYKAKNIVLSNTPEQCLNSVKIEAVEFAAAQINGQYDGELCQEILINYIEELRSK